ncbi:MAG: GLPGLI family protein [Weeksellaceae bacterium]|nr:GLPGLI family protein [Weeksellaceae bacterium]
MKLKLFFFLLSAFLSAQNFVYVVYEYRRMYDPKIMDYLLISNEGQTYFYNYNTDEKDYEKLLISFNGRFQLQPSKIDRLKGKIYQLKTIKQKKDFQKIIAVENQIPFDWKIENEYTQLMGMKVQKAITHFRGRDWTVWFASEIPLNIGPWKLGGLPGLILKAESDFHSYTAVYINLNEPQERFPAEVKHFFDDKIPTAVSLYEAIEGENEFIKYLNSLSATDIPEGSVMIPNENIRQHDLEVVFEWESN